MEKVRKREGITEKKSLGNVVVKDIRDARQEDKIPKDK